MNALFFNYEIIKISINTKLNEWITAHEADDVVVFIKYMCHQHDIEIKTYNDIIQMLKDVNETNIALKAEQMRLKKDVRNKNVIIRYLKIISSRQSSSASEARASKSIKLSNSFLFKDSSQNVNN